jgi:succinate dehydrogenase / fumarate reductase cytochrome b subunit
MVNGILTSWFGDLVMLGSVWALWYHLLGGVRHLIWDQIIGLDMKTAERMGWAVVIGSVVLTLFTVAVLQGGGA